MGFLMFLSSNLRILKGFSLCIYIYIYTPTRLRPTFELKTTESKLLPKGVEHGGSGLNKVHSGNCSGVSRKKQKNERYIIQIQRTPERPFI